MLTVKGRSWKLPDDSPLLKEQAKSELKLSWITSYDPRLTQADC